MSVRKLTASLFTALALLGGVAPVCAQHLEPIEDPFAFHPEAQWFEPVYNIDLEDMKPKKRAHTGWFCTYDRLNLYGSRPETDEPDISEVSIDGGWGHRHEIGYMREGDDHGWLFNATTSSIGQFETVRHVALNQYNGDQVIGGSGGGSATVPPFGFITPPGEANNLGYDYRFYDVRDTENVISYKSYELNKTWRLEPYHYGGILEPMVGVNWMRITDINGFQDYRTTFDALPLVGPFGSAEQLTSNVAKTENEMFGGQLGFRYFKHSERFTYSTNFRAFFGGNWQRSRSQQSIYTSIYDLNTNTVTIGAPPVRQTIENSTPIYSRNEEFYVGFDVRGELGYQLTKMISLRGGFQLIHIGRGLWRGGDGTLVAGGDNDQDLLLVGGTFGINLNH